MKNVIRMTCLALVVVSLGSAASAQDIVTVPVGNPGNAPDTEVMWDGTTGYGAVNYEYNIGKYEVTAGQYRDFLNAVDPNGANAHGLYNSEMNGTYSNGCRIVRSGSSGSYSYSVASHWQDRPVNYVSWYDAAMYANWATSGNIHKGAYDTSADANWGSSTAGDYTGIAPHDSVAMDALISTYGKVYVIPTEDEWYKAAYYDGAASSYYDYPTSSDLRPSSDLDLGGNNATFAEDGYTIDSPYYRTEVGAHENSPSPYDTFDQGGNVWEWNEALIGSRRGLRGGSFPASSGIVLHASYLHREIPSREYPDVGFRVATVPEPATMAILTLGGIGILRRRKCVRR